VLIFVKNTLARIGFWLMLPIAAIQGLRLRRTALRLPAAEGDRSGVCGQGKALHLLALGDSIIAGVGTGTVAQSLPVQFAMALAKTLDCSVHWRLEGANGADISYLLKHLRQMGAKHKADVVLISIGVNDVTGLSSKRHWKTGVIALTKALKTTWPQAKIIFMGLPPMAKFPLPPQPLSFVLGLRAANLDAITASLVENQLNVHHIPTEIDLLHHDFCEDGFHPSAQACTFWAKGLAQRLESDTLVR
jgi:lysophospholipase L1-like esterase